MRRGATTRYRVQSERRNMGKLELESRKVASSEDHSGAEEQRDRALVRVERTSPGGLPDIPQGWRRGVGAARCGVHYSASITMQLGRDCRSLSLGLLHSSKVNHVTANPLLNQVCSGPLHEAIDDGKARSSYTRTRHKASVASSQSSCCEPMCPCPSRSRSTTNSPSCCSQPKQGINHAFTARSS